MRKRYLTIGYVCLIGLGGEPVPGWSAWPGQAQAQEREVMDYGRLKRQVERRFGGRVVNQQLRRDTNPPTYRFRVVKKNGTVLDVVVNAVTGEVMKVEG